ncbi:MAG: lysophospholipase [Turicibacter sp.]|nr:lysophospholipase [Turicibacter sp.]
MDSKTVKAHDGANINVYFCKSEQPRAVVQIVHGFGEGAFHYTDLANFFAQNNYTAIVHDQRGFGGMPELSQAERQKLKGKNPGYAYFLKDIKTIRAAIQSWYPDLPVILYGHSMGGNMVLNHMIKFPNENYAKLVLESPWLRLHKPISKPLMAIISVLAKIAPNFTMSAGLEKAHIARSQDKTNKFEMDDVYHDKMAMRLLCEIIAAGENALENADKITTPTLLLCAALDKIVCSATIREFAEKANDNVQLVEYADGYHNLHLDQISDTVLADVVKFMNT